MGRGTCFASKQWHLIPLIREGKRERREVNRGMHGREGTGFCGILRISGEENHTREREGAVLRFSTLIPFYKF